MSNILRFMINGSDVDDIIDKSVPIINHYFGYGEDGTPYNNKNLDISIDTEPLPSPDAVIRTFIASITVVKE